MSTAQPNKQNNPAFDPDAKIVKLKSNGTLTLREVLLQEIKRMYHIEKAVLKAFPKMVKNACAFDLIQAGSIYLENTKTRIVRLEDAFAHIEEKPEHAKSPSIDALLTEAEEIIEGAKFGNVRDIGIVLVFHKMVHYKIATYTMLSAFSELIDHQEIMVLFAESLNEEKIMDLRTSKIIASIRLGSDEY